MFQKAARKAFDVSGDKCLNQFKGDVMCLCIETLHGDLL